MALRLYEDTGRLEFWSELGPEDAGPPRSAIAVPDDVLERVQAHLGSLPPGYDNQEVWFLREIMTWKNRL